MEYTQLLNIRDSINIVVYGAGTIGRIAYNELSKNLNIKIIAWSDQRYKRINDTPIKIISPQNIKDYSYNFIILAIDKKEKIKDIITNLIKIGLNNIISLSKTEISEMMER